MKCMKCDKTRRGEFCFKCGEKLREPSVGESLLAHLQAGQQRCEKKGDTERADKWERWHDLVFRLLGRYHAETQVLTAEKPKAKGD